MVNIGFIVEGDTEKLIIDSKKFREKLKDLNLKVCEPVINAKGNGNLLPRYLEQHIALLNTSASPDIIMVITDLESAVSPQEVRDRIRTGTITDKMIVVSIKAIESWFLGDSNSLSNWLDIPYTEIRPEETSGMPWDRIRELAVEITGRGPGKLKTMFAKKYIDKYGFCIFSAAQNANCTSAQEFRNRLTELGAAI